MGKKRSGLYNQRRAYEYVCYKYPATPIVPNYLLTVGNTVWLYPLANINPVLSSTSGITKSTEIHTLVLIFNTRADIISFYTNVSNSTAESQPVGNVGYSLGTGTILKDLSNRGTNNDYPDIKMVLADDELVVQWRYVKQLSDQRTIQVGGNSPNGTIGYVCIFESWTSQELSQNAGALDDLSKGFTIPYHGPIPRG